MMAMNMTKRARPATFRGKKLPCLTRDLRKAVANVLSEFTDDERTFGEVYEFLRRYATRKQAYYIMCYPDLVWEYCNTYCNTDWDIGYDEPDAPDFMGVEMRETVRQLVKESIRRRRNGEAWQGYYEKCLTWVNVGRFLPAPSEQGYGHYEAD